MSSLRAQTSHRSLRPGAAAVIVAMTIVAAAALSSQSANQPIDPAPEPTSLSTRIDAAIVDLDWPRVTALAKLGLKADDGDNLRILLARVALKDGEYASVRAWLTPITDISADLCSLIARSYDFQENRRAAVVFYRRALDIASREPVDEAVRRLIVWGLQRPLETPKRAPSPIETDEIELTDRQRWRATASASTASTASAANAARERPELAIDGDIATGFTTGEPMRPGRELRVDFGETLSLSRVYLVDDAGGATIADDCYPRAWRLEAWVDAETDGTDARAKAGSWRCLARGDGIPDRYAGASFPPVRCRAIRFLQDGESDSAPWTVYEVRAFGTR